MRNNSLDSFRLFATFAVICLHVGYGKLPPIAENNIRLLGRFAVPFFFLISGYYFYQNYQKGGDKHFAKTLQRLMGIFIAGSLVYLSFKLRNLPFTFSLLYEGTKFHLWFLSSLIFGLIICWYQYSYLKSRFVMIVLSVSIIVLFLLSESYANFSPFKLDKDFCRYLLSIPFVYIGALIAQYGYKLSRLISILLILLGIFMQIGESRFLLQKFGFDEFNHQLLVGTIPFSLGMFFLSFNGIKNNTLAELGRKYSLAIYVYHLFINHYLFKLINFTFKQTADYVFIFSPLISFGACLLVLVAINRYFPILFAILNGDIKLIPQIFTVGSVSNIFRNRKAEEINLKGN